MPLDKQTQDYFLTMAFLLRPVGAHFEQITYVSPEDVPQALEDLRAEWRRARCRCLSGELMRMLADLDEEMTFNVVNSCIAKLLYRVVPKYERLRERRRQRRRHNKQRKRRRAAREADTRSVQLRLGTGSSARVGRRIP